MSRSFNSPALTAAALVARMAAAPVFAADYVQAPGSSLVFASKYDGEVFTGKFPEFTEPDDSYHGTIYTQAFGKSAYIVKARTQIMRDMGACQTPFGAFLINQGLETLPLRIERHSQNADAVAHWLEKHDKIESVSYPTLEGNPYKERAAKYLPNGCSGVISFSL